MASLLIICFRPRVHSSSHCMRSVYSFHSPFRRPGMARRWWKAGQLKGDEELVEPGSVVRYDRHWIPKLLVNGFGALATAVVMLVFAITKFSDGAWVIIILVPILVSIFFAIHHHYKNLAHHLSLEGVAPPQMLVRRHRVIMPIAGVHRGTLQALSYARSLSPDVTVVHISIDAADAERVRRKWVNWGNGVRLVVLDSPFRTLLEPLLGYIQTVANQRQAGEMITIVVPQFVSNAWWHNLLHTHTAFWLRVALLFKKGIVITEVPYQVE